MIQYLVGEKKGIATSMKWMPTEKAYLGDNLLTKFSWFRIKREPWVAEVVLRPESPGGCRCPEGFSWWEAKTTSSEIRKT